MSLVLGLGLEHSCPWPRECLSSERLSLASVFFVSLASSLVSSTPPLLMTILLKAHVFLPRIWNSYSSSIKIIEVKKPVDEMKNLYKCNFNRTNNRKANKTFENFKENSLSPNSPISCEGCAGSSSRVTYHTLRFSINPIISLG